MRLLSNCRLNLVSTLEFVTTKLVVPLHANLHCREVMRKALPKACCVCPPLGLEWTRTTRPQKGQELSNKAHRQSSNPTLASALQSKTVFTREGWNDFRIQDLRKDSFIKSGDLYFKPTMMRKHCAVDLLAAPAPTKLPLSATQRNPLQTPTDPYGPPLAPHGTPLDALRPLHTPTHTLHTPADAPGGARRPTILPVSAPQPNPLPTPTDPYRPPRAPHGTPLDALKPLHTPTHILHTPADAGQALARPVKALQGAAEAILPGPARPCRGLSRPSQALQRLGRARI